MLKTKPVVRLMKPQDLDTIVEIDTKVFGQRRAEYYKRKMDLAMDRTQLNISLAAEIEGKVVGFMMGTIYFGEFGIPETTASLDTLGVDPAFQRRGVGQELMEQLMSNLKAVRVENLYTLVDWDDWDLLRFFAAGGFVPGKKVYLEMAVK